MQTGWNEANGAGATRVGQQAISVEYRIARTLGVVGLGAAHIMATLAMVAFFSRIVPMYSKLFADANVELNAAPILVIELSYFFAHYWYLVVLCVMVVDGTFLVMAYVASSGWVWLGHAWSTLLLLGMLLMIGASSLILSMTWNHALLDASPAF